MPIANIRTAVKRRVAQLKQREEEANVQMAVEWEEPDETISIRENEELSRIYFSPFRDVRKLLNSQAAVDRQLKLYQSSHPTSDFQRVQRCKLVIYDNRVTYSKKVTRIAGTLVKWIPNAIPTSAMDKLSSAAATFRSQNSGVHKRGGVTAVTYHMGKWRIYQPIETEAGKRLTGKDEFMDTIADLVHVVDRLFFTHFKRLYSLYTKANKGKDGYASAAFKTLALNYSTSTPHVDSKDDRDGICCVIPFGDYDGGALTMYDIGMNFDVRPGDVLFFRSRRIIHGNEPVTRGTRHSLVFFMHETGVNDYLKSIGKDTRSVTARRIAAKNKETQKKRKENRQKVIKELKTSKTQIIKLSNRQCRDRDLRSKKRTQSNGKAQHVKKF